MAERPIAGALKAPEGKPSGGSNPSLAALAVLRVWEEPKATAPSLAALAVRWDRRWGRRSLLRRVTGSALVLLIVIDILVVLTISIGVGALAPRWPDSWLESDPFPLALGPWETPAFYRGLRIPLLARRLPELGATFGGESKSQLPGARAST